MALDVYGGNPQIVASYEQLQATASSLDLAAAELEEALFAPQVFWLEAIPNPLPQIQLAVALPPLIARIKELAFRVRLTSANYFSTEAALNHTIQQTLLPISNLTGPLTQMTAFAPVAGKAVSGISAAFAVAGLVGKPNLAKSSLVATAIALTANAATHASAQQMVQGVHSSWKALGLAIDTSGSASLLSQKPVMSVSSYAGHARVLRSAYSEPATIKIQLFQSPSGKKFVVYVPGTQSMSLAGSNPLNLRSNITAIGKVAPSPTELAINSALQQLGAGDQDQVLFVGHSQGALVSGNLASSPQPYQVSGLISFGGPIAHIDLKVPTVAISHEADPVPLLAGGVNPLRENWVNISSNAGFSDLIDAHAMGSYIDTAAEVDESKDIGLGLVTQKLGFEASQGVEYLFEIRRG